jgi:hypothetical protein
VRWTVPDASFQSLPLFAIAGYSLRHVQLEH